MKVTATPEALALLAEIVDDHGPVLFHQSGGCCDGSSPMCYPQSEFRVGQRDVRVGEIGFGGLWKHRVGTVASLGRALAHWTGRGVVIDRGLSQEQHAGVICEVEAHTVGCDVHVDAAHV